MQAPKNGFFYVLDRATGQLLSAKNIVPINWATGVDMRTGRPMENPAARYSEHGTPWIASPGPLGAHTGSRWRSTRRPGSSTSRRRN